MVAVELMTEETVQTMVAMVLVTKETVKTMVAVERMTEATVRMLMAQTMMAQTMIAQTMMAQTMMAQTMVAKTVMVETMNGTMTGGEACASNESWSLRFLYEIAVVPPSALFVRSPVHLIHARESFLVSLDELNSQVIFRLKYLFSRKLKIPRPFY